MILVQDTEWGTIHQLDMTREEFVNRFFAECDYDLDDEDDITPEEVIGEDGVIVHEIPNVSTYEDFLNRFENLDD